MKYHNDEKVNQARHMILSIAGNSINTKTEIDLTKLFKILIRNSLGSIKITAKYKVVRTAFSDLH